MHRIGFPIGRRLKSSISQISWLKNELCLDRRIKAESSIGSEFRNQLVEFGIL